MNRLSSLGLLFTLFLGTTLAAQAAASPRLIPFQGRLTDQQGRAYTNGQFTVVFNLYSQAVAGTPVWTERHQKVGVINGMVNVFLGSITSLDPMDFSTTMYLGITIDADDNLNTPDPEMVPRQMIIPAFWAKNSEKLAGYDWSAILVGASNNPSGGKIAGSKIEAGGITSVQLAAGSVTANQLAPGAVTGTAITNGAIGSTQIASGAVGLQNLSTSVSTMLVPPGTIIAFAGPANRIPLGWELCDGNNHVRTDPKYEALFQAIGTFWGAPNGNEFNLPDLRGLFLRGQDDASVSRDPDRADRKSLLPNGNIGPAVGSYQPDEFKSHVHNADPNYAFAEFRGGAAPFSGWVSSGSSINYVQSTQPTGGSESRPKNAYVLYIIKY